MINNTGIDRCLKSDFKAFEQVGENLYVLRWGKKDEVERVSVYNEETKEHEFTGEVLETDVCTFECGVYTGELKTESLDKAFAKSRRLPSVRELKEMADASGLTEEQAVPWARGYLVKAIERHDKSKEVEDFTIQGVHLWLNSDMRNKVRENLETAQQKGEENVTLRYEGMAFPMTVAMGWQLYYAVLDYARATWDVTEINRSTALNAVGWDALMACEDTFKDNYPEKLAF